MFFFFYLFPFWNKGEISSSCFFLSFFSVCLRCQLLFISHTERICSFHFHNTVSFFVIPANIYLLRDWCLVGLWSSAQPYGTAVTPVDQVQTKGYTPTSEAPVDSIKSLTFKTKRRRRRISLAVILMM